MELLFQMLPFMIVSLAIAFPNYFLARRLKKSGVTYFILSVIPLINVFFWWYIIYSTLFNIFDRLEKLEAGERVYPRALDPDSSAATIAR
jgi:glucan phosphoethanolaminetransferase (alkaline phosphatase superfamily)